MLHHLGLFFFIYHIYPPFTRKRILSLCPGRYVRTLLGVAIFEVSGPPVFHIKVIRFKSADLNLFGILHFMKEKIIDSQSSL